MTERTVMFLVHLSHDWSPLTLALPVVFGVATYYAGGLWTRTADSPDPPARRLSAALRLVMRALFAVSIVVFLVSILHIGCATLKARSSQCTSHIKQLSLGALLYSQDYDEHLPASSHWAEAIDSRLREANKSDFFANDDPFQCPAAESPASYGLNSALGGRAMTEIDAPGSTVLLFDADAPNRSFASGERDVAHKRHNGMPNVAFADGHARWMNAFVLKESSWSPTVKNQKHPVP